MAWTPRTVKPGRGRTGEGSHGIAAIEDDEKKGRGADDEEEEEDDEEEVESLNRGIGSTFQFILVM